MNKSIINILMLSQLSIYLLISIIYPVSFFKNMQNGLFLNDISPLREFYDQIIEFDSQQNKNERDVLKVISSPEWSPFVAYYIKKPVLMSASCNSISIPTGEFYLISKSNICGEIKSLSYCEKDIIYFKNLSILKCNSLNNKIHKNIK
mgnify:CR=1 FL=1